MVWRRGKSLCVLSRSASHTDAHERAPGVRHQQGYDPLFSRQSVAGSAGACTRECADCRTWGDDIIQAINQEVSDGVDDEINRKVGAAIDPEIGEEISQEAGWEISRGFGFEIGQGVGEEVGRNVGGAVREEADATVEGSSLALR